MKNQKFRVLIHMGASRWDVTVHDAAGLPVTFDLYAMDREAQRQFHRKFMTAYRSSVK